VMGILTVFKVWLNLEWKVENVSWIFYLL